MAFMTDEQRYKSIEDDDGKYKLPVKTGLKTDAEKAKDQEILQRYKAIGKAPAEKTGWKMELPELDPNLKSTFNLNWRGAYENENGEKLSPNIEDAKKLDQYILNKLKSDNIGRVARDMRLYNPNTESWSEFIKSDSGQKFMMRYMADRQNYQRNEALKEIWNDGTAAGKIVDFMLPVSKEYAKNHYNDEDFSIAGPLAADIATNLVMAGPAALPSKVAKPLSKPLISSVYGNVAAPAITEAGNVIYNDESVPEAFVRTLEGAAINIGTPRVLEGTMSWAGRGLPTREGRRTVQKMIDDAANKAAAVQSEIRKGKPYSLNSSVDDMPLEFKAQTKDGNKFYSSDPAKSNERWNTARTYTSVKDMPAEAVTLDEMAQLKQGLPFVRGKSGKSKFANTVKELQDEGSELFQDELVLRKAAALAKDGDLRNLTPAELRQLGFPDKESFMNYLIRTFKNNLPSTASTYLTNAAGRPEFGRQAGPISNINRLFGTDFFQKDEDDPNEIIERVFGTTSK